MSSAHHRTKNVWWTAVARLLGIKLEFSSVRVPPVCTDVDSRTTSSSALATSQVMPRYRYSQVICSAADVRQTTEWLTSPVVQLIVARTAQPFVVLFFSNSFPAKRHNYIIINEYKQELQSSSFGCIYPAHKTNVLAAFLQLSWVQSCTHTKTFLQLNIAYRNFGSFCRDNNWSVAQW